MQIARFLVILGTSALLLANANAEPQKPNVLFIAIDDLNDWVGCLEGNPQAITPNLDRFAKTRGLVMNKAYAPAPVCGPSRSAILTGLRPSTTGVYGNSNNLRRAPKAKDAVTLPQYFSQHGYHTLSSGKIFHKHMTEEGMDHGAWAFDEHREETGGTGLKKREGAPTGEFFWGKTTGPFEKTRDYITCEWGSEQLKRDFDKPFFMAIGIAKPHLPFIVPQEFYDLYPLDKIEPVEFRRDDLDDILNARGKKVLRPHRWFEGADEGGYHREAIQAYLATVSFVDACVGRLLDSLEKSEYADNTIVMIWGDHGWHLGEKLYYGKATLWEESARVPFIVGVPGLTEGGEQAEGVVNLLDMYPTLVELCGLPPNPAVEGRSFVPLLKNPEEPWNEPTLTTWHAGNHSVTDGRYRYISRWGKGTEELYDHESDPMEWKNLILDPELKPVIERLRKAIPEHDEPESPENTISKKKSKVGRQKK